MRRASTSFALLFLAAALVAAPARGQEETEHEKEDEKKEALPTVPDDHPVHLDRTGIDWVLPFERARAVARERGHPLLVKAVAFGTTRSGCW